MIPNKKLIIIISVLISVIICDAKEPCSAHDSINITDGIKYPNGNIEYDDIVYTPDLYGIYEYEYLNSTFKNIVEPHFRGCICLLKSCIQFCCPRGQAFQAGGICADDPLYNISSDSLREEAKLYQKYGVVYGKPCLAGFFLYPEENDFDEWILVDNGELYINMSEPQFNSKDTYCLTKYYPTNDTSSLENLKEFPIRVYMCEEDSFELKFALYPVGE